MPADECRTEMRAVPWEEEVIRVRVCPPMPRRNEPTAIGG